MVEVEGDGNVRVNLGGDDLVTAEGFAGAGDDAPPLPGDSVALAEGVGSGGHQVAGYDDTTAKTAAGGERRMYARDPNGAVVAEVHARGDGSIEITSLISGGAQVTVKPDGTVVISGATEITGDLDVDGTTRITGDADVDGEVKAKASGGQFVTLTGLMIPSPFGPLGPPIPGS